MTALFPDYKNDLLSAVEEVTAKCVHSSVQVEIGNTGGRGCEFVFGSSESVAGVLRGFAGLLFPLSPLDESAAPHELAISRKHHWLANSSRRERAQ